MINSSPLVSVLMPVYNGEKYLREAIDSILNQTFTDFEFLIVNDGSTDSTENIILSYTDVRIRYIKNEENLKLIATLNKGLDLSQGKYIARMDADDISLPERLEKQVAFMEKNTNYILVGSSVEFIPENAEYNSTYLDHEDIAFKLLTNNCIYHSTVFFRKTEYRYSMNYLHVEDYELWLRFLSLGKLHILNDRLVKYRIHDQSICINNADFQYEQVKKIRFAILKNYIPNISSEEFEFYNGFMGEMTNDFFVKLDIGFDYSRESLFKLQKLVTKLEKVNSKKYGLSSKEVAKHLKQLFFMYAIDYQKLPRKFILKYIFSNLYNFNLFSKKILLKWILNIQ